MTEREPLEVEETPNYGELFNAEDDSLTRGKRTIQKPSKESWLHHLKPGVDIDRSLVVYKIFYFFYFAAIGSLQPYLALYFKHSLQLPAHLVGIVIGIRPFCLFFSAPILGTIADKYSKVRAVLVVALFSYIVSSLVVTVVPPVDMSCLSEVNKKLNLTVNETQINIHGNHTTKQENVLKHAILKHKQEEKAHEHLEIKERGNTELWKENWIFDVYRKLDPRTYEKAKVVFVVVLTITIAGELLGSTSNTLSDVATLQNLGNNPNDYGEQRLWGEIGWGITAFITGSIVAHQYSEQTDICPNKVFDIYRPFFYVYAALMTISLLVATRFKFNDSDKHIGERCTLFKSLEVFTCLEYIVFAVFALILGIAFGTAEAFLGIHLLELGATASLFSALVGVQCLSNLTLYYASIYLIKRFGQVRMIAIGLVAYSIRFFYFSIIPSAWLVLPIELFGGFCEALVWSSLASYVGTPPRIGATLQGILHGLYYGLGRGLGQIIGGVLIKSYSEMHFFRYFSLVMLLLFFAFLLFAPILNAKKTIWMNLSGYTPVNDEGNERLEYKKQVKLFWTGKRD
ncbi:major facilitator superfamily domain-containing protein 6-like [Actinia tenebrosa]|uniref:Major facilitator superfamily domain-containing protein 6-like n=1 Tax=Actinia tenebrosa TaxID=6105 RepID=A0A6P8I741_ACTTE|nr:major facilitator superfamily domain-containing protein 6-like [Actinia tenebrosa]